MRSAPPADREQRTSIIGRTPGKRKKIWDGMTVERCRFPPPWLVEDPDPKLDRSWLHRPRRQRAGARLHLLRARAGATDRCEAAHPRRRPAHRRQHRQAPGAVAARVQT
jgi:hypothetical protein